MKNQGYTEYDDEDEDEDEDEVDDADERPPLRMFWSVFRDEWIFYLRHRSVMDLFPNIFITKYAYSWP